MPSLARPSAVLGLFCSVRCPGSVILALYDAIRALRDASVVVAGGFQSPMERECLDLLLRGKQRVVVCPPRPRKAIPASWRAAIDDGRLQLLAPPDSAAARTTAAIAARRNEFVAQISAALLIAHASPGGKTEQLAVRALAAGKPVYTLEDPANANLVTLGAIPASAAALPGLLPFLPLNGAEAT